MPVGVHHPDSEVGALIAQRAGRQGWQTLVEVMGTTTLADPSNRELAAAFGATVDVASSVFDLAIVGAGPAGLGAAVYGASEGLDTLVLEAEAFGGQAGTSSMIRNYLGFPRGITGRQLGRRAVLQATGFGAKFDLARAVTGLDPGTPHRLTLDDGAVVAAHTVILACGVTYRRLGVTPLEALVGRGVFYGAPSTEARALRDADVVVVGAGNSGGQAAVHLARYAARVTIAARGASLSATMSDYLVREIEANPRIVVRTARSRSSMAAVRRAWSGLRSPNEALGDVRAFLRPACSFSSAPKPVPAGCQPNSSATTMASSSPAKPSNRHDGRSTAHPTPSRPASPACSPSATSEQTA